ncbi:MAG: fasciclin domain-containing protein [Planctomycetota bacterium]
MAIAASYLCALVVGGAAALGVNSFSAAEFMNDEPNIVDIASGNDNFETLTAALGAAGLVETVREADGITVLAPTDAAFEKLDQAALRRTIEDNPSGRLADILKFHVIPERLTAAELANRRFVTTLDGQRLEIGTSEGLTLNGSRVRAADIEAENGIIHAIDTVLIPAKQTVPEVAAEAGQFTTLLAAAEAAGLVDFLSATDPITVFAPTDEAFAKLGANTIETLLRPENRGTLREILAYHVVSGARVYSQDLLGLSAIEPVAGGTLTPAVRDGGVFINDSAVVAANIEASNGVVHVIDAVLLPSDAGTMMQPAASGEPFERVLRLAIDRGVPLFNDHQQAACAAIYEVAIASVLALEGGLEDSQRRTLDQALREGRSQRDAGRRAWTFRRGMDAVLAPDQQVIEVTLDTRGSH